MCRIFAFRSVIRSQVHRSLVSADNALMQQSDRHPDVWGVAYYNAGAPHVMKSVSSAHVDSLFRRVSGVVASETVLAHIRKATQGDLSIVNTHPFQYGHWVFVHNGNLSGFAQVRPALLARIPPTLRRYILGDTDSELLFYLLLGNMAKRCELQRMGYPLASLVEAVRETVADVEGIVGKVHVQENGAPDETYLTFALTNGSILLGHQGGKPLYWSTHKNRCPDRDACPSFGGACETAAGANDFVKHLVVSSEPLQGENVWHKLAPYDVVGVDWRMALLHEEAS